MPCLKTPDESYKKFDNVAPQISDNNGLLDNIYTTETISETINEDVCDNVSSKVLNDFSQNDNFSNSSTRKLNALTFT